MKMQREDDQKRKGRRGRKKGVWWWGEEVCWVGGCEKSASHPGLFHRITQGWHPVVRAGTLLERKLSVAWGLRDSTRISS